MVNTGMWVELLEHVGTENDIVDAARVSYNKSASEYTQEANLKLLYYLLEHEHTTPLEMCWLKFRVHVPIAIARQWMRHRMFSYNEISRRYTNKGISFYLPEELYEQDPKNKQASASPMHPMMQGKAKMLIADTYEHVFNVYTRLLQLGVSREQARFVLPMGMMTTFIAAGNLRSWLHFVHLRDSPHAQVEIQLVAHEIKKQLALLYPHVMDYYNKKES